MLYLLALLLQDNYRLGPDSERHDGVPTGVVTKSMWKSQIFENTERDWWIYVPSQYKPEKPACVMVFQDGGSYVVEKGSFRIPIVFDNLIAKSEMPVTIGIFLNPGKHLEKKDERSIEYDTLSDRYSRFLLEEILPEVEKTYNLSHDPRCRAICGISSGGICSWTVAWERPDAFRKVLSHVGSFTNIRSGHNYQAWLRKTAPKPIRIFMQDGANDLDNEHGNWPLANQELASSLRYMKYDFKFEFGTGGHNGKHGGASMPDSLRWLWRPEWSFQIKRLNAKDAVLLATKFDPMTASESSQEVDVLAETDSPIGSTGCMVKKLEPNAKLRGFREVHDHGSGKVVISYEMTTYQTDRLIYQDDSGHEREARALGPVIDVRCNICKAK